MASEVARQRRCVLFVHGVGEQKKSSTLLYMGSPLVNWVLAWSRAASWSAPQSAEPGEVRLSFVPFEGSAPDDPASAVLHLQDQDWYLSEAWWAASSEHPNLGTMLWWSLVHFFDIISQMIRATGERATRLSTFPRHDNTKGSQPDWWWQLIDLLNCVAVGVLYVAGMIVGYPLIIVLMIVAQIPIESVQNFVLLKVVRPLLVAAAGEFRMYLDDELQAANVRRRVADSARQLMARSGCDELILVAHSEGAVVSLGVLTDPAFEDVASRVRKLLTFGAGLNKTWLLDTKLERLYRPVHGDIKWVDTWASYDPVPAGKLDPSRYKLLDPVTGQLRKCQMTDIFQPTPPREVESAQVTNGMNVITDHGGYFTNDEQVVIRLAAEISSPDRTTSIFWPSDEVINRFVRKRRERVCALALWRDVGVGLWLLAAFGPWLTGLIQGVNPWAPIATIGTQAGVLGWVVSMLMFVRDGLPPLLAPVSGFAGLVLQVPALVGGAALVGLLAWAVFQLGVALWWQRWDRRARAQFIDAAVRSSLARHATAAAQADVSAAAPPSAAPPPAAPPPAAPRIGAPPSTGRSV